jgi:DNA-binding response OmpR family regulator
MTERHARVLVVEDDPDVRLLVQHVLEPVGDVVGVPDVYQALGALRSDPFDVIVLDLIFPGASGFDLMQRLTPLGIATPVVILTGLASDLAVRRTRSLGAHAFVTKPFDVDLFVVTVRGAIVGSDHAKDLRPVLA